MGSHGGGGNANAQQQQQQQFQNQQQQQNQLYQQQLAAEQASFANYMSTFNAQENQNLSAKVKPTGGFYGAVSSPQGTYLSSSGSRNTFLGG